MEKEFIKVLKNKEALVRDVVEKKRCVVMFGIKEEKQPNRQLREKSELETAKEILNIVLDQNNEGHEIEEIYRMGKYAGKETRPMKVKFKSQTVVEEVLNRTWKLSTDQRYKEVFIRRDMNDEERAKQKELMEEAKQKNDQR